MLPSICHAIVSLTPRFSSWLHPGWARKAGSLLLDYDDPGHAESTRSSMIRAVVPVGSRIVELELVGVGPIRKRAAGRRHCAVRHHVVVLGGRAPGPRHRRPNVNSQGGGTECVIDHADRGRWRGRSCCGRIECQRRASKADSGGCYGDGPSGAAEGHPDR